MSISLQKAMEIKDVLLDKMSKLEALLLLKRLIDLSDDESFVNDLEFIMWTIEESEDY